MESKSRRHFLSYLAGSVGVLAASGLLWIRREDGLRGPYQIVDRRTLPIGGLGLFVAVAKGLPGESLKTLGDALRREYREHPNMVVNVFDDPEAARTIRKGSRIVGEDPFQAAMAHQVASYIKDSRTGQHTFTVFSALREVFHYGDA